MNRPETPAPDPIPAPPTGLGVLLLVGPAFIWCAEYIGSGEVILSTRVGALLGPGVAWAIFIGIFLKYWIGMSGARYTACTGEGMMDMFGRMPGPRNWAVWLVFIVQLAGAVVAIGAVANAAGIFLGALTGLSPVAGAWTVTLFALAVAWTGIYELLKTVMSLCVAVIVLGVLWVAATVFPGLAAFAPALPDMPAWAVTGFGANPNPWSELLPLMGWSAGGFASQVWYTYWVLGAGYGAAAGRDYGKPADEEMLRTMTPATAEKIRGWCRVVYADATIAMLIGNVVTIGFLVAGAGVLGPARQAPQKEQVAIALSALFSERWGATGGNLFLAAAVAALTSTLVGILVGWPRLLSDAVRICVPRAAERVPPKTMARGFLLFFLASNLVMILLVEAGLDPVRLIKLGAVLDGLLFTPLQALAVGVGLFVVLPRMLPPEARGILRPHWIFAVGLAAAFLVFGYFCVVQFPREFVR